MDALPTPLICQLLTIIENAGFVLKTVSNHYDSDHQPHPFFQSFQFRPSARFHGYIDQLHVVFEVTDEDIVIDMEMIRDQSVLQNIFYWQFENPVQSFSRNEQQLWQDPLTAIQEYLNKEK